jgi:hypothetical protein
MKLAKSVGSCHIDWDEPHGLKAITLRPLLLRPGIIHRSREEEEILHRAS